MGPGRSAFCAAAIARLCGAKVAIVGLENDRARLDVARQYGCEPIVGDASEWARQGDGLGADGVVDATGVSAALMTALDLVRPGGWISKVGWGPQPLGFSLDPLVQKNVTLQGSFSHNWPIWERVIRLIADRRARRAADHRRRLAARRVARSVRDDALGPNRESGAETVSALIAVVSKQLLLATRCMTTSTHATQRQSHPRHRQHDRHRRGDCAPRASPKARAS